MAKFERYNKYLVLKLEDIENFTNNEQKKWLSRIQYSIRSHRLAHGKKDNSYVVVNEDQPYAEKVWVLIQEQWEREEKERQTTRKCSNCGWEGKESECQFGHNDFYCPSCCQEALEVV